MASESWHISIKLLIYCLITSKVKSQVWFFHAASTAERFTLTRVPRVREVCSFNSRPRKY